jgi:hypothetical protein
VGKIVRNAWKAAPAARTERWSSPIRRHVELRIAHQLAIRSARLEKLIVRRSATLARGKEEDVNLQRSGDQRNPKRPATTITTTTTPIM